MNELLSTPRNREIAGLLLEGLSDQEIAANLGIARGTLKQHLRMIYLRAGISSGRKRVRLVALLCGEDSGRILLPATLSPKEKIVAELVLAGLTNPQIAARCEMSVQVAKNHLRAIFDKCGVWSRTELAARFRATEGN